MHARHRNLGDIPYEPPKECEDAVNFFRKQKKIHEAVAKKLDGLHMRQMACLNKDSKTLGPLLTGEKVWYLRPEKSGNKLDTRWVGPALIIERESENSYLIEVSEGHRISSHRSFLKYFIPDEVLGKSVPLFYHRRTVQDPEAAPDEWIVDEVIGHRVEPDGTVKFLTKWRGYEDATWEPLGNFFHRYNSDIVRYCAEQGLGLDLVEALSQQPH